MLHHGAFYRLDCQEKSLFGQIVVHEGRALAMAAQTSFAQYFDAKPICLKGTRRAIILRGEATRTLAAKGIGPIWIKGNHGRTDLS